jgi:hypothetical protein
MIQIGAFRGKINTLKDAQFEPSHAADEITELLMQISYSLKPLKSYRSEPYFDYGLIMLGGEILEIQTWSGKRGWQDIYRSVELVSHKISIV